MSYALRKDNFRMLKEFIQAANNDRTVYISTVREAFDSLSDDNKQTFYCVLESIEKDKKSQFQINLPLFDDLSEDETSFLNSYVRARIYNILSSLGGRRMDIYADTSNKPLIALIDSFNDVFNINSSRKDRKGYGRCINVTDRMLDVLCPEIEGFRFYVHDLSELKSCKADLAEAFSASRLLNASDHIKNKTICGIDVGGTDIKIVLVRNETIVCYKEYDWFPASFTESRELVEPICMIVRLLRVKASLDDINKHNKADIVGKVEQALEKDASDAFIYDVIREAETLLDGKLVLFDAIGLCFPDVVVKNKIVGGEVYKTRGIRNNPSINFEDDFKQLTNLDDQLRAFCKYDTSVNIINDGPMAAFTAALENIAATGLKNVKNGVFAHTLGTELGTGWVTGQGEVPDIPLEIYNNIIDLGSFSEIQYPHDDLRSIKNFNTDLPGTLQKYTSQSGVFRLAMKYFPSKCPGLFDELIQKGFVEKCITNGAVGYYVPAKPKDQRKPFLEHMMALPERETDDTVDQLWKEIGEFLAVASIEMDHILTIETSVRILFGRLVKNKRCFELIKEGAKSITDAYIFEPADSNIANTCLMKQLKDHPVFTVAQFAQAVGAAYYGSYKLSE